MVFSAKTLRHIENMYFSLIITGDRLWCFMLICGGCEFVAVWRLWRDVYFKSMNTGMGSREDEEKKKDAA